MWRGGVRGEEGCLIEIAGPARPAAGSRDRETGVGACGGGYLLVAPAGAGRLGGRPAPGRDQKSGLGMAAVRPAYLARGVCVCVEGVRKSDDT